MPLLCLFSLKLGLILSVCLNFQPVSTLVYLSYGYVVLRDNFLGLYGSSCVMYLDSLVVFVSMFLPFVSNLDFIVVERNIVPRQSKQLTRFISPLKD